MKKHSIPLIFAIFLNAYFSIPLRAENGPVSDANEHSAKFIIH